MASDQIKRILQSLPGKPGVYQYFDKQEKILYVGKAKDLKKRVSSYFTKTHDSAKVRVMVGKIEDIRVIEVETELDALLLENNLIKEHQPRYNILLRDDKTYPWLCIKKEPFPRIFSTRNRVQDGSEYFGPYASGKVLKNMLDLIRHLYPIRTCSLNLSKANIEAGKFKVCLEYHIGNCLGPCEGLQTEADYLHNIDLVRSIVKGNLKGVRADLVLDMQRMANEMAFEQAQKVKDKLDLLDKYQARSTVVSPTIHDAEVFSVYSDVQSGFVNYLKIVDGALIQSYNLELRKRLDETDEEMLRLGMVEIGSIFPERSKEIYTSIAVESVWKEAKLHVPQRGENKLPTPTGM
jgi:excinuclease ABC subunit C